jgi:hypothetical protein
MARRSETRMAEGIVARRTEWTARFSRPRRLVLCGREHPLTHEAVCQGLIGAPAVIGYGETAQRVILSPVGHLETPPGSGFYAPTNRARTKHAVRRRAHSGDPIAADHIDRGSRGDHSVLFAVPSTP